MERNIIITIVIAILFFVIKFLEIRFIQKDDDKSLKDSIRDTIIVGISTMIGLYVVQLSYDVSVGKSSTDAFIGKPDF